MSNVKRAAHILLAIGITLFLIAPQAEAAIELDRMGTARPTAIGGPWALIADTNHEPQGFGTPTCLPNGVLSVPYLAPMTKVIGSAVTTDETWSRKGIVAGASVGLDHLEVWFTRFTADGPVALSCAQLGGDAGNVWLTATGR